MSENTIPKPTALNVKKEIKKLANPEKAKFFAGFFKTGKGQYAEGDIFAGLTVPQARAVAKKYGALPLPEVQKLLKSEIHEERLTALLILRLQFEKGDAAFRGRAYQFYVKNLPYINNWDLVDLSALYIAGVYLFDHPRERKILVKLAKSKNLWERRVAMLSTFHFIRKGEFSVPLKIAKILVHDEHDLIHKAVGWLLREIGNRDVKVEERFLEVHASTMPRTMLRYAIEKFSPAKRKRYLNM